MAIYYVPRSRILAELQKRGRSLICAFEEIRFAQEGNHVHEEEFDMDFDPEEGEFVINDGDTRG